MVSDFVAGRVEATYVSIGSVLQFWKAGKIKVLAIASAKRHPALPEVPTVAESGMPGFEVSSWQGVLAPAGTPREVVARLNAESVRALAVCLELQADAGDYGDLPMRIARLSRASGG